GDEPSPVVSAGLLDAVGGGVDARHRRHVGGPGGVHATHHDHLGVGQPGVDVGQNGGDVGGDLRLGATGEVVEVGVDDDDVGVGGLHLVDQAGLVVVE